MVLSVLILYILILGSADNSQLGISKHTYCV
jgi:hypothetical protein